MTPINLRRLEFELRRIRNMSILTLFGKTASKLLGLILGLLLFPVTALLHLANYRHVTIFTDRIGHLALEPDCLLKEQSLGHIPCRKWIMLAPPGRVANEHLLNYWAPDFLIVRNPIACFLIKNMSRWGLMRYDIAHYGRAIGTTQAAYRIYAEWSNKEPLLKLTTEDEVWGKQMLEKLGLPKDAWFVCVHAREAGFSPIDEEHHRHRNSRIENTILAMEEIVRRGGWVIRIGDPTMQRLPSLMPQIIDYAHHALRSPRLDVVLCAQARFILGNTSGVALLGTIFGVPCALANLIPLSTLWFTPMDISIPKLTWSRKIGRHLRIDEILESRIGNFQYAANYDKEEIDTIENTSQDILLLTQEMLDRLNSSGATVTPDDGELLEYIRKLYKPGHYAYGSAARMSLSFLKHHAELLPLKH